MSRLARLINMRVDALHRKLFKKGVNTIIDIDGHCFVARDHLPDDLI